MRFFVTTFFCNQDLCHFLKFNSISYFNISIHSKLSVTNVITLIIHIYIFSSFNEKFIQSVKYA